MTFRKMKFPNSQFKSTIITPYNFTDLTHWSLSIFIVD